MTDKPGIPLPSLEEIAADPKSLKGLSRDALLSLALQGTIIVQRCGLAALQHDGEAQPNPGEDATLDVKVAARLLGISPHTLRNRARTAPYASFQIPTGTRRLAFSRRRIIEWQQQPPPAESPRMTPKAPPDGTALAAARRRLTPGRGLKNFANPPFLGWRDRPGE